MTQESAPQIAELHHRMPVILPAEQIEPWLTCENGDYGSSGMFNHHAVNSFGIKDDSIELIDPNDIGKYC